MALPWVEGQNSIRTVEDADEIFRLTEEEIAKGQACPLKTAAESYAISGSTARAAAVSARREVRFGR